MSSSTQRTSAFRVTAAALIVLSGLAGTFYLNAREQTSENLRSSSGVRMESARLAARPKGDLLVNGDFEQTTNGYQPWVLYVHATGGSYTAGQSTAFARTGKLGIEVRQVFDEVYGALAQHLVHNQESAQTYQLRVFLRGQDVVESAMIHVDVKSRTHPPRYYEMTISAEELSKGWIERRLDAEVDAGRSEIDVTLVLYGPGSLHIDDVSLAPVKP